MTTSGAAEQRPAAAEVLPSSLDRLGESHWHLHQMEQWFHFADPFRFSLNCFLRAIKEVPQLVQMELQNCRGFTEWFRPQREKLSQDELLVHLFKSRDVIVHRQMLVPESSGFVGITRGRVLKLGISIPIDPLIDSDESMQRVAHLAREQGDFMGIFRPEDEDTAPCIQRTWKLQAFPNDDLVDLAAAAWRKVAEVVAESVSFVGAATIDLDLTCAHGSELVQLRIYDRAKLAAYVYGEGSSAGTGPMAPSTMMNANEDRERAGRVDTPPATTDSVDERAGEG